MTRAREHRTRDSEALGVGFHLLPRSVVVVVAADQVRDGCGLGDSGIIERRWEERVHCGGSAPRGDAGDDVRRGDQQHALGEFLACAGSDVKIGDGSEAVTDNGEIIGITRSGKRGFVACNPEVEIRRCWLGELGVVDGLARLGERDSEVLLPVLRLVAAPAVQYQSGFVLVIHGLY